MARIKIDMPEKYIFSTDLDVRISDINYGNHVGNDSILSIVHESRCRFFASLGFSELDVEGFGIIMTDSAIVYKSESHYGETLTINISTQDHNKYGCDIIYQITEKESKRVVAEVKTGIVFFDYAQKKVVNTPQPFLDKVKETAQNLAS